MGGPENENENEAEDLLSKGDGGESGAGSGDDAGGGHEDVIQPIDPAVVEALSDQVQALQLQLAASREAEAKALSKAGKVTKGKDSDVSAEIADLKACVLDLKSQIMQPVVGVSLTAAEIEATAAPLKPFDAAAAAALHDSLTGSRDDDIAAPSITGQDGKYIVNPRRTVEHDEITYGEGRILELKAADAEGLLKDGFIRPLREHILQL